MQEFQRVFALETNDFKRLTEVVGQRTDGIEGVFGTRHDDRFRRCADDGVGPGPAAVTVAEHLHLVDHADIDVRVEIEHFDRRGDVGGVVVEQLLFAGDERSGDAVRAQRFVAFEGEQAQRREVIARVGAFECLHGPVGFAAVGRTDVKDEFSAQPACEREQVLEVADRACEQLPALMAQQGVLDMAFPVKKDFSPQFRRDDERIAKVALKLRFDPAQHLFALEVEYPGTFEAGVGKRGELRTKTFALLFQSVFQGIENIDGFAFPQRNQQVRGLEGQMGLVRQRVRKPFGNKAAFDAEQDFFAVLHGIVQNGCVTAQGVEQQRIVDRRQGGVGIGRCAFERTDDRVGIEVRMRRVQRT